MVFPIGVPGFRQGSYKRSAEDREITFRKPAQICYACQDTGVVVNGDGAVNEELADYDRLPPSEDDPQGRQAGGHDLALICTCEAAFAAYENGAMKRSGYREPDGSIRLVDGRMAVGVEPPAGLTTRLHDRRLQSWKAAEQAMNEARRRAAHGDPGATPWFIAEVRNLVQEQARRNRDTYRGTGALQALGSILSDTLQAPDGPLSQAAAVEAAVAIEAAQPEAAA